MPGWPTSGACPSGSGSLLLASAPGADRPAPVVGPCLTAWTPTRSALAPKRDEARPGTPIRD